MASARFELVEVRVKTVVTGGRGFIGSHLVRRLRELSHDVVVFDSATLPDDVAVAREGVIPVRGDVRDLAALERAMDGATRVVHLAALSSVPLSVADPLLTHEVNATGTLIVLEAARRSGVEYVLLASSSAVFGETSGAAGRVSSGTAPLNPYAASKLALEGYASAYRSTFGLPTQSLRLFNVYGPGQSADHPYAAVIPRFVAHALTGRPLPIEGDGQQTRDFVSVETVCEVIVRSLRDRISLDHPISVGSGDASAIEDVAAELEHLLGFGLPRTREPARGADIRHSVADVSDLAALFPDLERVSLREGLRATLAWYRSTLSD